MLERQREGVAKAAIADQLDIGEANGIPDSRRSLKANEPCTDCLNLRFSELPAAALVADSIVSFRLLL